MAERIKDFAKDLNLDVKEVIKILEDVGCGTKQTTSSVNEEEMGMLINRLSMANQTDKLDNYLDGQIVIPSKKKKVKKTEPAETDEIAGTPTPIKEETAKTDTDKKAKAEPASNTATDAGKKEEATVSSQAVDNSGKATHVKTDSSTSADKKQNVQEPSDKKDFQQKGNNFAPRKDFQPRNNDFAQRKDFQPRSNDSAQRKDFQPRNNDFAQRKDFQPRNNDFAQRKDFQPRNNDFAQKKDFQPRSNEFAPRKDFPQRSFDRKPDFTNQNKPVNRNDFRKNDARPQYKQGGFGSFGDRGGFDKDRQDRRPVYNPAPKVKHVDSGIVEIKKKTGATRIVDTRISDVDLSKYDDKIENITSGYDNYGPTQSKQKIKKQNTKDQYSSKKEKERLALEKVKRAVFEKAKNTQLAITIPAEITVGDLAQRLKVTSGEVVKKLMMMGVMASVNQVIDYDTAYLIADEFGAKATREVVVTIEEKLFEEEKDEENNLCERAPVVCVMGHVDHGKTSLLDAIRHTNVIAGEAGGITQHIGAYRVNVKGKEITFLDTPGHEAFTAMRLRGAMATDIAIIVVAADDGIMPQTVEAINHAKAAGVDIIVAINKMDKPTANPDNIKQELTKYDLVPEEWGGDVICVPVSAITKMGIDNLLETILLVSEVKELKANPNRQAKGIVIEAKLDKGRGPVATILVQNGTLRSGDVVIAGTAVGRVRAMTDHNGKTVKEAGPSVPVEIIGLDEVPVAGDEFNAVKDEKMARELASQRKAKAKEAEFKANAKINLDDLFAQISEGNKEINVIVKADVDGSAEAVKTSLLKLSNSEVKLNVIHTGVGGITESDVMLAAASNAIIVGFNVRPDKNALDSAQRQKVDIRTYRIIYEIIEEMEAAIKGMLAPTFKEVINGHAQVRQTIRVPSVGTIAGSYIQDGKITRSSQIRIIRDGIVIAEDKIASLRRFKDDVKEVAAGYECGVGLDKFNDIHEGDILEAFEMQEVKD